MKIIFGVLFFIFVVVCAFFLAMTIGLVLATFDDSLRSGEFD